MLKPVVETKYLYRADVVGSLLRPQASLHEKLSEREKELHGLLLSEATLSTIAKSMGVKRTTVATLAARLYRKLGVKGRLGLVPQALGRKGITP